MSAKVNLQQKIDKKIYLPFRAELMKRGISIQKGLEKIMERYTAECEKEQRAGKK